MKYILILITLITQNYLLAQTTININSSGGSSSTFTQLLDTENSLGDRTDQIRVNLLEDELEFFSEDDDSGGEPLSFTFLERISDVGATQAVASDGKYLYTTGYPIGYTQGHDYIMKWTKQGVLVAENPSATTDGTLLGTQVNSMDIKDGLLYISCNNYANPQVPAAASSIKVFKTSDLTFVTEYQVKNNICEGYSWHDGNWWGVYNDLMIVSRRDANFNPVAEYPLTYPITGSFNYQGIVWIDDYILCTVHEGTSSPQTLDVYKWNGSGFDEVRRIDQIIPSETGQGIFKEPGKDILWWAERGNPTVTDNHVIKTRINYLTPTSNN